MMTASAMHPLRLLDGLMRRLRMPVKLAAMGLLLLIPLLLVATVQYPRVTAERATALSELGGARVAQTVHDAIGDLQLHRDLTHRTLNGDAAAGAERSAVRERLAAAVGRLETGLQGIPGVAAQPAGPWEAARAALQAMAQGRHAAQRDEAFAEHTQAIDAMRRLMFGVAEHSQLLLDPVGETYFLMELSTQRLLALAEAMHSVRSEGTALLHRGDAGARERAHILGSAAVVRGEAHELETRLAALRRTGGAEPPGATAAVAAARKLAEDTRRLFGAESIDGDPAAFHRESSAALEAVNALQGATLQRLATLLDQRAAAGLTSLQLQVAVFIAAVVLVGALGWSFYRSFYGALRRLHEGVDAVTGGDLSHRVEIEGRDEVADIGRMVERMNERLSAMVAEIRSSATRVGMAGRQVAEGSTALAQRTEEQASSLQQTLTITRELSRAVAQNAAAAGELDRLTQQLRQDAEAGGTAMRETVESMGQLESSAQRVGEITAVIDGIAFQTNILALNAAVEAARAGASGRGFAVVATEVRQLAQRSARAAAEIRQLIGQSGEQMTSSVSHLRNVERVLGSLVQGVRTASDALRGIADASARQSADLEQVTQSVGSLDEITRQNSEMVAQSTGASEDLVARAGALSQAVASMRLRQGSADEAATLVERALSLLRQRGLQGAAAALHSREQGFVDRDLYVFVIDCQGTYRLHGAKPEMEGRRVHDVPGIDGDRFVRDAWSAAERGSGWIDYDIVNPETGVVQPKTSYIAALDAQHFVGCGVYRRTDALAAAGPGRTAAPPAPSRPLQVPGPVTARAALA